MSDYVFPEPEDGSLIEENELNRTLIGSFGWLPAEAFTGTVLVRNFKWPYLKKASETGEFTSGWIGTVDSVLGYAGRSDDGSTIARSLPWTDTVLPFLCASRVDVYGLGGIKGTDPRSSPDDLPPLSSTVRFKHVVGSVHFCASRFKLGDREEPNSLVGIISSGDIESIRFATKEIRPGIEHVTGQRGAVFYDDVSIPAASRSVPYQIPITQSFNDIIVTLYGWPIGCTPITAINECLGKVNASSVDLPDIPPPKSYGSETLLLHSYALRDDFFSIGDRCEHITYHFKHRKNTNAAGLDLGWNSAPYLGDGEYRTIKLSNGDPLFKTVDFLGLFLPEPLG